MILKHCLAVVAYFLCCSYSYSEIINSRSPNAAEQGLNWVMKEVLPQYTGLTVNGVNYTYTAVKKSQDPFVVNVENLQASGNGYIFRSRDDWSGLPGNTITRTIPTDNIPINLWGAGQIRLEGIGQVTEPVVRYIYRYDTCKLEPVTDASCPNYRPPQTNFKLPEEELRFMWNTSSTRTQEEQERDRIFVLENAGFRKPTKPPSRGTNRLINAQAALLSAALDALNKPPGFAQYSVVMPGGTYAEAVVLKDRVLPDSRNSRRFNQSQQQLHQAMINSQFNQIKEP